MLPNLPCKCREATLETPLSVWVSDHSDQVLRKDSKMGTMKAWAPNTKQPTSIRVKSHCLFLSASYHYP